MTGPFIGSTAVASGQMSKYQLASRYVRLFPDVYVPADLAVTASVRAIAAWLWSGQIGVVAGFAAAALHGSRWVDAARPVDLIHDNRHRQAGVVVRGDRVDDDDVADIDGVSVTTPARTALDLSCWYPRSTAVAAVDALARATDLNVADAELLAERATGRRGIRRARRVLRLVDAGAQSPKETWLRLLVLDAGFPPVQTQIPVFDEFGDAIAYLDMGWEELKIALEYDGDHHRTSRSQFSYDRRRLEMLRRRHWVVVVVTADDKPEDILRRVRDAIASRRARAVHAA
ncbi:hypothetical protein [Mycolicibacterium confluentis]|uniref:Uncharacterized protein n=1 Tax=Mycolicibacterium confluentis TaxID=28047 RepID=A0A7I7XQQ9_9MYCO|nr:hypothetical protein [Mycolicibacterium confluentis]MCV7322480.1 hypothetical protein [Mycolicibacterium confluentis]ORV22485.1 hypothetical protein AWB99_26265 [Mycolicibacterium confluentis]BBZ31530.1 hypothetical protein MCNF_01350 [Mycolicibacterium confluentis]